MNTYILIDSALIEQADKIPPLADDVRPRWLLPIYQERAYSVSPLLIDVAAAVAAEAVEPMMAMANACWPQLHSSIIDAELALAELAEHLRKFIHINTEEGEELTLRFADCAVLPILSTHFSPSQWSALAGQFACWRIHGRDGNIRTLPIALPKTVPTGTPLILSKAEISESVDAMGTDRLLANLRQLRPNQLFAKSPSEEFQMADAARTMWHAAGHQDNVLLLTFIEGVFITEGRLLRILNMCELLSNPDPGKVEAIINRAIAANYHPERDAHEI